MFGCYSAVQPTWLRCLVISGTQRTEIITEMITEIYLPSRNKGLFRLRTFCIKQSRIGPVFHSAIPLYVKNELNIPSSLLQTY